MQRLLSFIYAACPITVPPTILYAECSNYDNLKIIAIGGMLMLAGGIPLLYITVRQLFRNGFAKRGIIVPAILGLAVAFGIMSIYSSSSTALEFSVYTGKMASGDFPLHYEIDGLQQSYHVGETIQFLVKFKGYGPDCRIPDIAIRSEYDRQVIWDWHKGECSPAVRDVDMTVHVGGENGKPLIINQTGAYNLIIGRSANSFTEN